MGKRRRIVKMKKAAAAAAAAASETDPETGELNAQHFKKQKTSHSQLAETPSGPSKAMSGLDNLLANENQTLETPLSSLANENQKLETPLSSENVKKKKHKKKRSKTSASGVAVNTGLITASPLSSLANENQKLETSLSSENVKKKPKSKLSKTSANREKFKQQLNKGGIFYFKGQPLEKLLEKLSRAIGAEEQLKGQVHDNIWMKQMFSVGINDVTRTLERMPIAKVTQNNIPDIKHPELVPETFAHFPISEDGNVGSNKQSFKSLKKTEKQVIHLQAVLTAIDCHPRVLVSHFPGLASSRDVPILSIEDHGKGSLRLGQLLKLKRACAIGVKAGKSTINEAIQDIIDDQGRNMKVAAKPENIA